MVLQRYEEDASDLAPARLTLLGGDPGQEGNRTNRMLDRIIVLQVRNTNRRHPHAVLARTAAQGVIISLYIIEVKTVIEPFVSQIDKLPHSEEIAPLAAGELENDGVGTRSEIHPRIVLDVGENRTEDGKLEITAK